MNKVRCNHCDEVFDEEDIYVETDMFGNQIEHCIKCGKTGALMDMED